MIEQFQANKSTLKTFLALLESRNLLPRQQFVANFLDIIKIWVLGKALFKVFQVNTNQSTEKQVYCDQNHLHLLTNQKSIKMLLTNELQTDK